MSAAAPPPPLRTTEPYDCVVIGAGLSGLCSAALLAKAGWRVLVCEAQPTPGGCCVSFWRKGYRFDLSVQSYSGCGPDGAIGAVLRELGVEREIEFRRLEPAREYLFPDRAIQLPASLELYRETLLEQFPGERDGLTRYFRLQREIYDEIRRLPAEIPLSAAARFENDFPRLTTHRHATLAEVLATHVADPRLRAILAIRSSYFALPPSRASFIAVSNMELNYFEEGVYVARGGAQALTDVLVLALRKWGGELALGTPIKRVLHEHGRLFAVETADGRPIAARRVIASIAPTTLFGRLLDPPLRPRHPYLSRLAGLRTSHSYFISFWGVASDALGGSFIGNKETFDDYDLEREYAALERRQFDPRSPCFILVPSLLAREAVPGGRGHTVCASLKAPHSPDGGWTPALRAALDDRLFDRARACLPALDRSQIEVAESVTPIAIERLTGNLNGSPYGWAHTPGQIGLDRPGPATPLENLFLVGHWTRPGGGVASVIVSARSLAARLLTRAT